MFRLGWRSQRCKAGEPGESGERCKAGEVGKPGEPGESGLSTLEWILLVAAVGGLALVGVLIARGAVEEAGDRAETSGEGGSLRVVQNLADQVMADLGFWHHRAGASSLCDPPLGADGGVDLSVFWSNARFIRAAEGMAGLNKEWGETLSFHYVALTTEPSNSNMISDAELRAAGLVSSGGSGVQRMWCRARSLTTGRCGSIALEEPVGAEADDGSGYNDPSDAATQSRNICKGRV